MLCKKLFFCMLAFCLCGCVSKKHSVKTTTRIETDSLVQVQVQRDTIYWHGTTITNEKISVTVSRWDAENNQWQPETKTDTERNTEVASKDTTSVSTEHVSTDYNTHVEQKEQEKEVTQQGPHRNILDAIVCLSAIAVLLVLVFGPKNKIKQ